MDVILKRLLARLDASLVQMEEVRKKCDLLSLAPGTADFPNKDHLISTIRKKLKESISLKVEDLRQGYGKVLLLAHYNDFRMKFSSLTAADFVQIIDKHNKATITDGINDHMADQVRENWYKLFGGSTFVNIEDSVHKIISES